MKKVSFLSILSVLLTLGFSACNSVTDENALTNYVPGDAAVVARVDGTKIFEAADITVKGDKVEIPAYLDRMVSEKDAKVLGQINDKIKLDNIYLSGNDYNDAVILAEVADYDGLTEILEANEDLKKEKDGDIVAYLGGNACFAVYKEKYLFLVKDSDPVKFINKYLDDVKKNPLSKNDVLAEAVSTESAADLLLNYGSLLSRVPEKELAGAGPAMEYLKTKYIAGHFDFDGNKAILTGGLGNIDGTPVEDFATIDEINTAILAYVPEDFNFITAVGKNTPKDPGYYDELLKNANYQVASIMGMFIPYIKSIDGSSMLALRVKMPESLGVNDLNNYDGLLMVHMPMEKIQEAVNAINSQVPMLGISPVEVSKDLYSVNIESKTVYYGAADGYFVISTVPVEATHSSSLTKYFVNRTFAMVFDGKGMDQVMPFYPLAVCQSEGDYSGKVVVTLEGTTEKFIPAFMQFAR